MLNLWVSQNIFLLLVYRCELVRPSLYQNKIKTGIILKWDNKNNYLSQDKSSQVKSEWDKYILLEYRSWNIAVKSPWKSPWKVPWKIVVKRSWSTQVDLLQKLSHLPSTTRISTETSVTMLVSAFEFIDIRSFYYSPPLKVLRLCFCWYSRRKSTSR